MSTYNTPLKESIMSKRPAALTALIVAALALTGCDPHAGDKCDESKEKQYYSTHTENGKTKTIDLVCVNGRWRKA